MNVMNVLFFRFWDEQKKKYNAPSDCPVWIGHKTERGCRLCSCQGFIVERCTGLIDRVGRFIYEGDIVEINHPGGITETATVKFEENGIDGIYPFNRYHDCGDDCHCKLRDFPEHACKIIGNIHEQKDNQ